MSFKDMFYKAPPEDKPEKVVPSPQLQQVYKDRSGAAFMSIPTQAPVQVDATSSDEFNQYLAKIMDDANLPGPDYYEFSKALDTLKALPLTEEQKYVTIFATFGAQGIKPQDLIDAAMKYITILGQKKSSEFDSSVQSAEVALKATKDKIVSLGEDNIKLQKQMTENARMIGELTNEFTTKESKLEIKKTTFNMAYQNFINKIMGDIENIKKYLINGSVTK